VSPRRLAARLSAFETRYRSKLLVAQWLCFAVSRAAFAGFVRLPAITMPAYVGVVLTFLRYAVWQGWLRRRWLRDAG